VKGTPLPDEFRWRTDLVGRGYRAAQARVAPSRAFAEATQRIYELEQLPEIVHNGRAPNAEANVSVSPVDAIFTAGRLWDEAKNIKTLDRVAALTSVPIRAAGATHGPNGTEVTLDHIEALGPLPEPEMRKRFAERPIYVSAALFEPFGLAVLEAAQAGCALVLSDIESLGELWHDSALFVPPHDEEGFAAAIGRLLSDPDLRADYAHAAQNRARAFGLDAFSEDMAILYRSILSDAGRKDTAA
jgi:glycosyltransferase involved in cell wall biosynthesis